MLFHNACFSHSTVIMRVDFLKKHNISYDESLLKAQDYGLWAKCLDYTKIHSLREVVLFYRVHPDQITINQKEDQNKFANSVRLKILHRLTSELNYDEEQEFLRLLDVDVYSSSNLCMNVLEKLNEANKMSKVYDRRTFEEIIFYVWSLKIVRRIKRRKKIDFVNMYYFSLMLKPRNFISFIDNFFIKMIRVNFIIKKSLSYKRCN
jgi:hypothetical protein